MAFDAPHLSHLTPKQARFVVEYVACGNGAEAARRAGYSERAARQIADENMSKPDVATAIEAERLRMAEEYNITERDVVEGLLAIAKQEPDAPHAARVSAWNLLGKQIGMFADRSRVEGDVNINVRRVGRD